MASNFTLKLHGRAAYLVRVAFKDAATDTSADLSEKTIFFEIDKGKFRKELEPFAGDDPTVRYLYLSRAEVDQLPVNLTDSAFLDESVAGREGILGLGKIQRVGWKLP